MCGTEGEAVRGTDRVDLTLGTMTGRGSQGTGRKTGRPTGRAGRRWGRDGFTAGVTRNEQLTQTLLQRETVRRAGEVGDSAIIGLAFKGFEFLAGAARFAFQRIDS